MNCKLIAMNIVLIAYSIGLCENIGLEKITIGRTTFLIDSQIVKVDRNKFERHFSKIEKVIEVINGKTLSMGMNNVQNKITPIIILTKNSQRIEYKNIVNYGISSILVDENDVIKVIDFISKGERDFTAQEMEEYKRTREIPKTYFVLTEDSALAFAKQLNCVALGKEEADKFDLISVRFDKSLGYLVRFKIKEKNDIRDTRCAEVRINPYTGKVVHYSNEGLSSITFDYIPKIPKNQAVDMYNAEIKRVHADITLREMHLAKYQLKDGTEKWVWKIYGDRHDKYIGTSAMMFIDSETEEVLFYKMD